MSTVLAYLRSAMAFEDKEQFRILFLDRRNKLISDEVQSRGTIDHTPVYTREVVKRALELSASAIILAHNHPSGDPTPSKADVDMTKQIIEVASKLGLTVHDHVVLGRDGHLSMKTAGIHLIAAEQRIPAGPEIPAPIPWAGFQAPGRARDAARTARGSIVLGAFAGDAVPHAACRLVGIERAGIRAGNLMSRICRTFQKLDLFPRWYIEGRIVGKNCVNLDAGRIQFHDAKFGTRRFARSSCPSESCYACDPNKPAYAHGLILRTPILFRC